MRLVQITREQAGQLYELGAALLYMPYNEGDPEKDCFEWGLGTSPMHPGLLVFDADTFYIYEE